MFGIKKLTNSLWGKNDNNKKEENNLKTRQEVQINNNQNYSPQIDKYENQAMDINDQKQFSLMKSDLSDQSSQETGDTLSSSTKKSEEQEKEQLFTDLLKEDLLSETNQWQKCYSDQSTSVFKKTYLNNPAIYVRAQSLIKNANIKDIFDCFYITELRVQWDDMLKEQKVIEQVTPQIDYYYQCIHPGIGITRRDWVLKRIITKNEPNSQIIMIAYDSQHPAAQEIKGTIRCLSDIGGYRLTQKGEDILIEIVSCVDIKGNVPKFIVNKFADKGTKEWIDALETFYRKKFKNN